MTIIQIPTIKETLVNYKEKIAKQRAEYLICNIQLTKEEYEKKIKELLK